MALRWEFKTFDALTAAEVYALLKLRSEVFVVEQNCVFLDMDDKDQMCHHLLGYKGNLLAAYTRIVPMGVSYPDYPSIGRVITSPQARGEGLGKILMEESIQRLFSLYGHVPIKIGAQLYLKKFYESLGFVQCGDVYDEDGIPHLPMLRSV
ncbi:GNAT family N-acetyltransferase [Phnomibacter ginsenosidimutans]|jgi:ElaA protein|uniref:GNAT family N-acetyltransferase n=1 Tax=Phnomibacter ginsenosidimutans TaxID=2676868 RepID=A0A6I6GXD1_9BACT|nr:GNAT family N-acetyltransferase [Phnomibacter ginsenosidimutans]QGW27261.1 GNAT family N-acetyltransferase [Phnomibacter ginsenosidimutans]